MGRHISVVVGPKVDSFGGGGTLSRTDQLRGSNPGTTPKSSLPIHCDRSELSLTTTSEGKCRLNSIAFCCALASSSEPTNSWQHQLNLPRPLVGGKPKFAHHARPPGKILRTLTRGSMLAASRIRPAVTRRSSPRSLPPTACTSSGATFTQAASPWPWLGRSSVLEAQLSHKE